MSQTGRRQITERVDDSLHTRIQAQVLDGILSMRAEADSPEMAAGYVADAVIQELKKLGAIK